MKKKELLRRNCSRGESESEYRTNGAQNGTSSEVSIDIIW